jgi:SAM-dependent methyltransferase
VDYDSIKKTEDIVATYSKHIVNGYCHICKCDRRLLIDPDLSWSNTYACFMCGTGARTRGFIMVLDFYFSDYKHSLVHEAGVLGSDNHISNASAFYTSSHWDPSIQFGTLITDTHSNQNLEQLTFADNTFDYFITQDVFEHINYPEKAAKEIMRVLKPGGKHVFSVPRSYHPGLAKSRPRIKIENDEIIHLEPPEYHYRNNDGSSEQNWLVTYDYGPDFLELMHEWTHNDTSLYVIQELPGVVSPDKIIEVFVTTKT